ncbi:low molecular weight protein-tyrosine-phosphatase [Allomuricauda sp. d1]|uniref:low molecular weight protein-tyrosine-phosphatase n=1 Tax=Allomuricauda sp. d1 TaxID=3136725 RepID=UPI0031D12B31
MTKVLMVCLGNICRSPLAEGILKSKVAAENVTVDSAGTGGYHIGEPPDPRSIDVARQHGLDISMQRCRKFRSSDFEAFDLIYVMDNSNYANVLAQAATEAEKQKVRLLLKEADLGITEVPDPYYGGTKGFENVYQMIDSACSAIAQKLNRS